MAVEIRWDEKSGLRMGCGVRSQVIDLLKSEDGSMATVANSAGETLVPEAHERIDLTPTGLLMEVDSGH